MTETKSLTLPPKVWRFGKGVPFCDGMAPDVDPQNLSPQNPYLMINMRVDGGVPTLRPGQLYLCDLSQGAGMPVTGMWDHQIGTARSLYIGGDGCPSISPTVGAFIGKYDSELRITGNSTLRYENVSYFPSVAIDVQMGLFSDEIYFGVDAAVQRLGEVTRFALPTGYSGITAFMEHEGVLCLAAKGTAAAGIGTSAIFTFDGTTLTNVLSAINPVVGFFKYRDMLGAVFNGTPNSVRIRSSAGVWSAGIAPSGGTVKVTASDVCASYKDKCYIPGGDEDIFVLDQTLTLTQIPKATTGVSAGAHIMAVTVADEGDARYLYYAWHDAAATTVKIGRFDGTTWTPSYKNLTAQASWPTEGFSGINALFAPAEARVMKFYRGQLVLACVAATGLGAIYFSPRTTFTGTWTRAIPSPDGTNGDIRQLLVF